MAPVPALHLLRVFCADDATGGNPLAVFLADAEVPPAARQGVAADLGLSETVFVDDPARAARSASSPPTAELDFAGHPTVGTAWLLARESRPGGGAPSSAGEVPARYEDDRSFVAGRPEWPPSDHSSSSPPPRRSMRSTGRRPGRDLADAWSWIDEQAGLLRSRVFPVASASPRTRPRAPRQTKVAAKVGRPIDIRQGRGSRILARPLGDGMVEIGGRVALPLDEVRDYSAQTRPDARRAAQQPVVEGRRHVPVAPFDRLRRAAVN